jgi:hypothetical protein
MLADEYILIFLFDNQQRFWPTDFFSTFVRNLNFINFNWADSWAGRAMNSSTAASPTVVTLTFLAGKKQIFKQPKM